MFVKSAFQPWRNFWLLLFALVAAQVGVALFMPRSVAGIAAQRGIADFGEIDFAENGPVALKGEFAFYWGQLWEPADFAEGLAGEPVYLPVPGYWSEPTDPDGTKFPAHGVATYRVEVILPESLRGADGVYEVGLLVPEIMTAYRLWINGRLKLRSGKVAENPESARPNRRNYFILAESKTARLEIVVEVSNWEHRRAGIWDRLIFGAPIDVQTLWNRRFGLDLFLFGVLVVMGIYHLGLFGQRPVERGHFWFGMFCLVVSIRVATAGEAPVAVWLDLNWATYYRLSYLSYYLSIPLFASYLQTIYPEESPGWFNRLAWVINGAYALIALATPISIYSHTLPISSVTTVAAFVVGFWIILRAIGRRRRMALLFMGGFLVLFVTAVNDLLYANILIDSGYLVHLGIFVFIAVQSNLLATRFTEALALAEELSTAMEQKVHERTRQLKEAKQQAEILAHQAQEASKTKSAFLAVMSHEIRTPMNGVLGMASLMEQTSLNELQREYLKTIRLSGDALLALIDDILDFSKIEAGRTELEIQPFSLRHCAEEAVQLIASKAAEKELLTTILFDPEIPEIVLGDKNRLRQVLGNLLSNAVKFTAVGEVVLEVRRMGGSGASEKAGEKETVGVKLSVHDTGIGIPHERQEQIFHAFAQADSSTTRKYGGTGLGLTICKKLVHLMGGDLQVKSVPGQGAEFYFELKMEVWGWQEQRELHAYESVVSENLWVATSQPLLARALEFDLQSAGLHLERIQQDSGKSLSLPAGLSGLVFADEENLYRLNKWRDRGEGSKGSFFLIAFARLGVGEIPPGADAILATPWTRDRLIFLLRQLAGKMS